jgi:hypothetical protein
VSPTQTRRAVSASVIRVQVLFYHQLWISLGSRHDCVYDSHPGAAAHSPDAALSGNVNGTSLGTGLRIDRASLVLMKALPVTLSGFNFSLDNGSVAA